MPSTLRIGRVVSLADPALLGIKAWDADGDQVSIAGPLHVATITDAKVMRRQLLGLAENTDEPVVPVTWSADATIDGYYRVRKTTVRMKGPSLATGWFDWSAQLERVKDFSAPLFESMLIGTVRTNSHSITAAQPWHVVPSAVADLTMTDIANAYTLTGADGNVLMCLLTGYLALPQFHLAPASYYVGAAVFETGATLRTVVGRQCENLPTAWRLSNGFVRVTPSSFVPGRLDIAHVDAAGAWETAKTYQVRIHGSHHVDAFSAVSVLRNSPEEVVIRLVCHTEGGVSVGPVTLDLALRRGDRTVAGVVQSDIAYNWRVGRNAAEAATAFTGGIRATANDADGNRFGLFSSVAHSTDLTDGAIYATGTTSRMDFGITLEVAGSASVVPDRIADLTSRYFAAQAEKMTVVGH